MNFAPAAYPLGAGAAGYKSTGPTGLTAKLAMSQDSQPLSRWTVLARIMFQENAMDEEVNVAEVIVSLEARIIAIRDSL